MGWRGSQYGGLEPIEKGGKRWTNVRPSASAGCVQRHSASRWGERQEAEKLRWTTEMISENRDRGMEMGRSNRHRRVWVPKLINRVFRWNWKVALSDPVAWLTISYWCSVLAASSVAMSDTRWERLRQQLVQLVEIQVLDSAFSIGDRLLKSGNEKIRFRDSKNQLIVRRRSH
jgi:hypothetical protein